MWSKTRWNPKYRRYQVLWLYLFVLYVPVGGLIALLLTKVFGTTTAAFAFLGSWMAAFALSGIWGFMLPGRRIPTESADASGREALETRN
jgi:hypothetical protein